MDRFLCDEMLGRLCRYLRAAGYDAALAREGVADCQLLLQCQEEARRLLTLDHRIVEHKAAAGVAVILHRPPLEEQAEMDDRRCLRHRLAVACVHRCLIDNSPLLPASIDDRSRIPWLPPDEDEPVSVCPECERVYWRGSHYRRMRARLEAWQRQRMACLH